MSMIQCPRMPNTSVPEAYASVPSNKPAPNTMGTIPSSAQSFVRCGSVKNSDEIRIAMSGPCRFSMGLCM